MKKNQVAIEFMVLSGLALVASIIFVSISIGQTKSLYETKEFLLIKDVGLKIQNEISITSYVENGYSRQFDLPQQINNIDYNITIVNNTLIVWTNSTTYFTEIINITGYLKKGSNTISKTNGNTFIN